MRDVNAHLPLPWCVEIVGGTVGGQAWKGPIGRATVYALSHAHHDLHLTLYVVMDDGPHVGELWMVEHVFVRFCCNLTWGRPAAVAVPVRHKTAAA